MPMILLQNAGQHETRAYFAPFLPETMERILRHRDLNPRHQLQNSSRSPIYRYHCATYIVLEIV